MTNEKLESGKDEILTDSLYQSIRDIIHEARQNAYRAINFAMVQAYWNIGRLIVEEEQKGRERAEYGTHLIQNLAGKLTAEFGKGFTQQNLRNFRQFYLTFKLENNKDQIRYTLRSELSWSHYRLIMRLENPKARQYYMNEAAEQNWNVRALERQINSFYYERILASRGANKVVEEARQKTKQLEMRPEEFIKDPYILEFLDLNPDLPTEQELINELEREKALILRTRKDLLKKEKH